MTAKHTAEKKTQPFGRLALPKNGGAGERRKSYCKLLLSCLFFCFSKVTLVRDFMGFTFQPSLPRTHIQSIYYILTTLIHRDSQFQFSNEKTKSQRNLIIC
jgi:hypothetical protein